MPAIVDQGPATNASPIGESTAAMISSAHGGARRLSRRKTGASEAQRRMRPRASGSRWKISGGLGMRPSRSEPSTPANAQYRSLTITTPFGRAIPPRRGSASAPSAAQQLPARVSHGPVVAHEGPPRLGGTAHEYERQGPSVGYQTLREKNPSSASTSTTIRMIQRIPMCRFPPFHLRENERQAGMVTGRSSIRPIAGSTPHRPRSSAYSALARAARALDWCPLARAASRSWPCARPR